MKGKEREREGGWKKTEQRQRRGRGHEMTTIRAACSHGAP